MEKDVLSNEQIKMIRNVINFKEIKKLIEKEKKSFIIFNMKEDFPKLGIRYKSFIIDTEQFMLSRYSFKERSIIYSYIRSLEKLEKNRNYETDTNSNLLFPKLESSKIFELYEI